MSRNRAITGCSPYFCVLQQTNGFHTNCGVSLMFTRLRKSTFIQTKEKKLLLSTYKSACQPFPVIILGQGRWERVKNTYRYSSNDIVFLVVGRVSLSLSLASDIFSYYYKFPSRHGRRKNLIIPALYFSGMEPASVHLTSQQMP